MEYTFSICVTEDMLFPKKQKSVQVKSSIAKLKKLITMHMAEVLNTAELLISDISFHLEFVEFLPSNYVVDIKDTQTGETILIQHEEDFLKLPYIVVVVYKIIWDFIQKLVQDRSWILPTFSYN